MKYIKLFLDHFKNTPVFSFRDVQKFLKYNNSTAAYARIFISAMIANGRVNRVTKGFYSLYTDIEVVGFPFYAFYYGLGFALSYHALWKQQSNPHVITTNNVRVGTRTALNSNFIVSRIPKNMFFGYAYVKGQRFFYPVSDIEKTLIDTLYYRFNLEDYVYENIFRKLDTKKMKKYLKLCDERIRTEYQKLEKRYEFGD